MRWFRIRARDGCRRHIRKMPSSETRQEYASTAAAAAAAAARVSQATDKRKFNSCTQVSSQVELQWKYESRVESLTCITRVTTTSHSTNPRLVETLNMVLNNVLDRVRNEILI